MKMTRATAWIAAIAIGLFAAACDNPDRGDAVDRAGAAAERAGEAAGDAARDAVDATREAGRDVGDAVAGAVETMDVKTALLTDSRVDAGDINVDTNHDTKTVVLKGTVPTAEQKAIAEQIAVAEAEGYRIENDLMVAVP